MKFEFSDEAALKLIKALRLLPSSDIKITIKIGECFNKVRFETLV